MALIISDPNHFSNIEEITSDRASWNFKAEIIRLWTVSDFNRLNNPFSIEMVLKGDGGARIHATVKKTLIYKFKDDLKEGNVYTFENLGVSINGGAYRTTHHPYKMNFQFSSIVQKLTNCNIEGSPFQFVPIADVVGGAYDTDFLVDVIGVLTGVGTEREITNQNGTSTKLNVIALEAGGHKLQCTLFGPYVDELNTFLASGETNNTIVVVQLAKAKSFQDKMHIQNCVNCTRVYFNPDCHESSVLRESLPESHESPSPGSLTQLNVETQLSPEEEFIHNTPRMTLQGLKDATAESLNVVCATVKRVLNPECFWYTACVCNKSVIPDSNMYFCEKCNRHVTKVFSRYYLKLSVMDHTDHATFVLFDRDAHSLFNMSCADMIQSAQRNGAVGVVPPQISNLVDNTWLFKVETKPSANPRFEQTFRVRKICTTVAIINMFKAKWESQEASISKTINEVASLSTLGKGKDVLLSGSTNILCEDALSLTGSSLKPNGKDKVGESSELGITQDLMNKFSTAVVNLADDSTFTQYITKPVAPGVIYSKDLHACAGSSLEFKGKVIDVEGNIGRGVDDMVSSGGSVVVDIDADCDVSAVAATPVKVVQPKAKIRSAANKDLPGMSDNVIEATPVKQGKKMLSGGVKQAGDAVSCDESNGANAKKGGKRVSPQAEDQDDNAPIKLLRRAVKIEKIG